MPFEVYFVSHLGIPKDHHAIFVETNADKSGVLFHVIGSVQQGMRFEQKQSRDPLDSPLCNNKEHLGTVAETNYNDIENIVSAIESPKKQHAKTKHINPHQSLRICQEWTAEAIQALKETGILRNGE
ncbi:MAG: hypothetical protein M1822_008162 [Bathelium mastoideum]|nr:MAG: hypothetical protein M1822_008162 [Bathelium mastoideum]